MEGKTFYGHIFVGAEVKPFEATLEATATNTPPASMVFFTDQWECTHELTLGEASQRLKEFYDAWPGGLEEIESALRTARKGANNT